MKILAASAVAAFICAAAGAAAAPSVNLFTSFKPQIAKLKAATGVPVLLPTSLPMLTRIRVYATGSGTKKGWDLELAFAPNCGEATACYLASFQAEKAGKLPGRTNARLANGDLAFFLPSGCGASCSPESLWFIHGGVLYSLQDSGVGSNGAKAFMLRLANQAVSAGPR